jgi:hypothetical protein
MRFGEELGGLIECDLYGFDDMENGMEFRRRWIGWSLGYKVIGNTFGIFLEFKFFETIILLFVFNVVLRHHPPQICHSSKPNRFYHTPS